MVFVDRENRARVGYFPANEHVRFGREKSMRKPYFGPVRALRRGGSTPGFSFIELLVVLAILAMIIIIGVSEFGRAVRRAKLQAVSNELANLVNQAHGVMRDKNLEVFLKLGPKASDGTTPVQIITDNNADGILCATAAWTLVSGCDQIVREYSIPADISLAPNLAPTPADTLYAGPKTQVASELWSDNSDSTSVARALRLTFKGLAVSNVTTSTDTQITGPARLALTHLHMVGSTATLRPQTVFELRINPLWHATTMKGIWNGTKFVYSNL